MIDYLDTINGATPWVFLFVLGLSFVLLMVVFRSLLVPLKAIIMNLLSVGAAYGLMVAVFQKGWGAGLLGLQKVDFIEAWVPLFLFAVLFGTSMDYHVFLLSRIRERFDQTGDNRESVAFGVRRTGGIITGAALIMVAVFGGFAAGDLVMFQQLGFGLAVAVFLDATIVRSVLVPAAMRLLGNRPTGGSRAGSAGCPTCGWKSARGLPASRGRQKPTCPNRQKLRSRGCHCSSGTSSPLPSRTEGRGGFARRDLSRQVVGAIARCGVARGVLLGT